MKTHIRPAPLIASYEKLRALGFRLLLGKPDTVGEYAMIMQVNLWLKDKYGLWVTVAWEDEGFYVTIFDTREKGDPYTNDVQRVHFADPIDVYRLALASMADSIYNIESGINN